MLPFPGQSIGVPDANDPGSDGWGLYRDVWLRGQGAPQFNPSAGHRVIEAGDTWYAFAYHWTSRGSLLDPGDTVELVTSWVVEVLSGSGTLAVSDYDDDGFTESLAGPFAPVGTIEVDGPGTYTVETSTFSNEAIRTAGLSGGTLAVKLVCTGGSIDVQQVKFRAWPEGGPLGGWSAPYEDDPGVTNQAPRITDGGPVVPGTPSDGAGWPSQEAMRESMADAYINLGFESPANDGLAGAGFLDTYFPGPDYHVVVGQMSVTYIRRPTEFYRYSGPGVLGTDYALPPYEVEQDANTVLFQPTGADLTTWSQNLAYAEWNRSGPADVSMGSIMFGAAEVAGYDANGTNALSLAPGSIFHEQVDDLTPVAGDGTGVPYQHDVPIPEFTGPMLRVVGFTPALLNDTGFNSALGGGLRRTHPTTGRTLTFSWTPAAYRYWDPSGSPEVVDIPRQWLQRHDGKALSTAPSWRSAMATQHGGQWRGPV